MVVKGGAPDSWMILVCYRQPVSRALSEVWSSVGYKLVASIKQLNKKQYLLNERRFAPRPTNAFGKEGLFGPLISTNTLSIALANDSG